MPAVVGEDNRNAISALADQAINADKMQDYISCVFALCYVVVVTIVSISKVRHIQSARVRHWYMPSFVRYGIIHCSHQPLSILQYCSLTTSPSCISCSSSSPSVSSWRLLDANYPTAVFSTRVHIPGSFLSFAQPCVCVLPRTWYFILKPVPFSIECLVQPMVDPVRQLGWEIPICDVWIADDCLHTHLMSWLCSRGSVS